MRACPHGRPAVLAHPGLPACGVPGSPTPRAWLLRWAPASTRETMRSCGHEKPSCSARRDRVRVACIVIRVCTCVASKVLSSPACVHACAGNHGAQARSCEFATGSADRPGTPCRWLSSASGGRGPSWCCAVCGHARTYFDAASLGHEWCGTSKNHSSVQGAVVKGIDRRVC